MTDYACQKPCKYCTVTGSCPRRALPLRVRSDGFTGFVGKPHVKPWHPNDGSEDVALACGDTIPWPVVQAFGQNIHGQIWCSVHAWQPKLTKKQIEKARKVKAKKAGEQTLDSTPPF